MVLREVSEWTEQVHTASCVLGGWEADRIGKAAAAMLELRPVPPVDAAAIYGGGCAARRIVDAIEERWA